MSSRSILTLPLWSRGPTISVINGFVAEIVADEI